MYYGIASLHLEQYLSIPEKQYHIRENILYLQSGNLVAINVQGYIHIHRKLVEHTISCRLSIAASMKIVVMLGSTSF